MQNHLTACHRLPRPLPHGATGQLGVNNCQPDCAAGTSGYTPATVTLSGPVLGAGGPYFTHLQIIDPSVQASMKAWTLGTQGPGS